MRLARNRTVRHRSSREALDDRNGWLNFVDRYRRSCVLLRGLDSEETADRQQLRALIIEEFGEGVVAFAGVAANGVLQQGDRLWRPTVGLSADPISVFAADFERSAQDWRQAECIRMAALGLLRDFGQAGALDRGRGAEEEFVDR